LAGEHEEHIRALIETGEILPPIVVHRQSMQVIDGMHRLRAAGLRGAETIDVRFFEGSEEDAFVLAVEANTRHGLPLSLADREAAAGRILHTHRDWSDRAIAAVTGLAPGTVGVIRRRSLGPQGSPDVRVGRDGRRRPVNAMERRAAARELILSYPDASLRKLAKMAGVSPSTVREVRRECRRSEVMAAHDEAPGGNLTKLSDHSGSGDRREQAARGRRTVPDARSNGRIRERNTIMLGLRRDPSLRYTEAGRALLCWLDALTRGLDECDSAAVNIPAHCAYTVAELAHACADQWAEFARVLLQRTHIDPPATGTDG
jgi:ParB-like chromosome segregation protein Spo0J